MRLEGAAWWGFVVALSDSMAVFTAVVLICLNVHMALFCALGVSYTVHSAENLQPIGNDGDGAATEDDDSIADGVPATHPTTEASAYWVQAKPTLDESFTPDAVDYQLEQLSFRFQPYQLDWIIFANVARSKSYMPNSRK
ncbi:unnamed protein product [Dovyalis caffra]|uniref:Uncharacterized protein n=1 Tax=Dovyalis caffra TaxID=77055 RepID=A0AAV1R5H5_9ROSI|nr:unnamed protein product [Dovyalis caffra]